MNNKQKYIKYKKKYINLKKQLGGNLTNDEKLLYLKKFAGMYTFSNQSLKTLKSRTDINIKLTSNNEGVQPLDLGKVKVIYSKMISKLRKKKKLDSIDIVDEFNYLVIFKEAEQEKYYVIIPYGKQQDFSDESEKNRWLKFSQDLYKIILNEINKSSSDAYVKSDASSDADNSVDKKTIIFFGHSAGGVIAQLILYQFYLSNQLEKYNIGMITSGIFPIWEKKKDKNMFIKSLINKEKESIIHFDNQRWYDDRIFLDSNDEMKNDEIFKNKFKDKNIGDILDFTPQKRLKRRIEPSYLSEEQTTRVVYTRNHIHFNGMMIKNYMEKNHEFITVKCNIIFTTMIDLKNNTEHLKSSINNNNIGDRILINKVERKIEKINPLLNKSLYEFKYLMKNIKAPIYMDNLKEHDINYTFLLKLDWYDIDRDKTNILKKFYEYLESESNIYTFDNIDDFKKLENKNIFIFNETNTAKKYILINNIILSIKSLNENVLYLLINNFFLLNINDFPELEIKDINDFKKLENNLDKINEIFNSEYELNICYNNKKIINLNLPKDYFLRRDEKYFLEYIDILLEDYMKEYPEYVKEDNELINDYLNNNNQLTIDLFEEIEKFLYLNINLVSMNEEQIPDGYVMKKRDTTVFTIGRNNIYLLEEQSSGQILRKCQNTNSLSCYSSLKKGCENLNADKCFHDWKVYYKKPIKDLHINSVNF